MQSDFIEKKSTTPNREPNVKSANQEYVPSGKGKVLLKERDFFGELPKLRRVPKTKSIEKQKSDFRKTYVKKTNCKVHDPTICEQIKEYSDIPEEWFEKKVWDILCNHSTQLDNHTKEDYFRRVIRWRKGCVNDMSKDSCVLCDIQKTTSKSLRSNLDLDKVNYTHEYYNQFSRTSDKNGASPSESDDKNLSNSYVLSPSPTSRIFSNIVSPCRLLPSPTRESIGIRSTEPPGCPSRSRPSPMPDYPPLRGTPDSEHTESRAEKLRQMYMPLPKTIHSKCKPRRQPVQMAPQHITSKLHIAYRRKAFKGLPQRLHGAVQSQPSDCINQQIYNVDNLGLRFNLPDYNPNLGNRHVSIPKSYSYRPVVLIQKGVNNIDDGTDQSYIYDPEPTDGHSMMVMMERSNGTVNMEDHNMAWRQHGSGLVPGHMRSRPENRAEEASVLPPIRQYPASVLMQCVA